MNTGEPSSMDHKQTLPLICLVSSLVQAVLLLHVGASSPPVACFGQIKFVLEYDKTVLYTSVYSPSELLSCSTGVQGGVAATSLSTAEEDASSLSVNDMGILLEHHLQSCCLHNIKNSTAIVLYLD